MLKRLFTILFTVMLTVSCLQMAVAEENAVSEQNVEPTRCNSIEISTF